jgi:two-component system NtrC family sensor kinase
MLTDIVMPGGMDGLELARAVRSLHPSLRMLLSTGYSSAAQDAAAEGFALLTKPFGRAQLQAALAALLTAAGDPRSDRAGSMSR